MHQLLLVLVGAIGIGLGLGAALFAPKVMTDARQEASVAVALEEEGAGEGEPQAGGAPRELHEIVKVIDGDTVTINMGGKNETVRLIGIDTPETNDTRTGVQCFGAEATAYLKKITGERVAVEKDASQGERDKYKRLLTYVFSESGTNLNQKMIEDGYAYEYTYDDAYKYQTEFKAAEEAAKKAERGLWAPDACPEPAPKAASKKGVSAPASSAPLAPVVLGVGTTTAPPPPQKPEPKKVEPEVKKEEPALEPEPEEEPPAQSASQYTCGSNKYNCTDFKTRAEAQAVYDQCGGASNDVHKLDSNKDGEACESLP